MLTYHGAKRVVKEAIFCPYYRSSSENTKRIFFEEKDDKKKDEKKPIKDIDDFIDDRALFLEKELTDEQLRFFISFSMKTDIRVYTSFMFAFGECEYSYGHMTDEEYNEEFDINILDKVFPFLEEMRWECEEYSNFVIAFTKILMAEFFPDIKFK